MITGVTVDRLLFDGNTAVGVEGNHRGQPLIARARRKVVVSCGAIGSPSLLMRSGVGPGASLREHGIPVVADRPQVGLNLQEHAIVNVTKFVNMPSYSSQMGRLDVARHIVSYLLFRKGPIASTAVQAMALTRTDSTLQRPDIQLHFTLLATK